MAERAQEHRELVEDAREMLLKDRREGMDVPVDHVAERESVPRGRALNLLWRVLAPHHERGIGTEFLRHRFTPFPVVHGAAEEQRCGARCLIGYLRNCRIGKTAELPARSVLINEF